MASFAAVSLFGVRNETDLVPSYLDLNAGLMVRWKERSFWVWVNPCTEDADPLSFWPMEATSA